MIRKGQEWDVQCKGNPDLTFSDMLTGDNAFFVDVLKHEGFTNPSPIQIEAIEHGLDGKSIIAQSKSGTGKTLSFLTLLFCKIKSGFGLQCVILSPTRELSNQIYNVAIALNRWLPKARQLNFTLLIGGLPIKDDLQLIGTNPDVVIGTVGRIALHFTNGHLKVDRIRLAVIDEADVLIKGKDFRGLFGTIRHEKAKRPLQVCCYSATFNRTNFAKYTRYLYPCIRINNNCVIKEMINVKAGGKRVEGEPEENTEIRGEGMDEEPQTKWRKVRQSLNVEALEQYTIILDPPGERSLSLVKMDWIVKILKNVNYQQCMIFYNDKGRGDQIISELK